jgi:hypothetical protein
MDELLRELLSAPLFAKPSIGTDPFKAVAGTAQPSTHTPVNQFMEAVGKVYDKSGDNGFLTTDLIKGAMGTSKLFFDHAMDQAEALNYVHCGRERTYLFVTEAGRAALIKLGSR